VSKWDNLKIVPVLEGQVASGALPKTGAERVCGNGLSQHVAVSELEDDGHQMAIELAVALLGFYVFFVTTICIPRLPVSSA
jgi:hypothetical protein